MDTKKDEDTHYDANWEIRTKGVGFYQFSKDGETRKKEMEALNAARLKTENQRSEREAKKDARRKEIEQRRQEIKKRKQGKEAEAWLNNLVMETGSKDLVDE